MEDDVLSHSDPATGFPVGPRADRMTGPEYSSEQVLDAVIASVEDDKAEDVVQIDLRGRSDVADYSQPLALKQLNLSRLISHKRYQILP